MIFAAILLQVAFPLAEGTEWLYRGTTRGDFEHANVERKVRTTMRVISHGVVGRFELAVVDGEPSSISCAESPEPRHLFTVIVRDGAKYYELVTPNPDPLAEELTTQEEVEKALEGAAPFLDLPMHGRTKLGEWTIEELAPRAILGKTRTPFRLTFRTEPDDEILEFVEGVGITRYRSVHHGSPCEVDLALVGLRPRE